MRALSALGWVVLCSAVVSAPPPPSQPPSPPSLPPFTPPFGHTSGGPFAFSSAQPPHVGVDSYNQTVFELPPAPRSPYGAHQRRGVSVIQLSPKGGDISGNITVLVMGTAFRDFGVNPETLHSHLHAHI